MFRFACLFNLLVRVLFETSHWNTRFIKCVVICPIWTCFARKHPYNAQAIDYIRDATWFKNYYILLQEYFHIYKMFLQTFEYFRETLQISSSDLLLKFILLLVREIYKIMQRNKRRMHEIYIYICCIRSVQKCYLQLFCNRKETKSLRIFEIVPWIRAVSFTISK